MPQLHPHLRGRLACPSDNTPLRQEADALMCDNGHSFAIVDGIPILLLRVEHQTHGYAQQTLEEVDRLLDGMTDSVGQMYAKSNETNQIDPWVQEEVVKTCGNLYWTTLGKLHRYPIPRSRLPISNGKLLVDIGCNWGRWTVACTKKGYRAIGVDPSLRALRAAKNVCRQLNVDAAFVACDARHLPFADGSLDVVFSYSVLQHFSKEDLIAGLHEVRRVLAADGFSLIQMANAYGLRQAYRMYKPRNQPEKLFAVRRYSPKVLRQIFESTIGQTSVDVDGYFSLNAQFSDLDLLPLRYKTVVLASELLRQIHTFFPIVGRVADSLYLRSTKN